MANRGRFEGTMQILRFNPGFYAGGVAAIALGSIFVAVAPLAHWLIVAVGIATAAALWWLVGSILASYWVYDASDLMEWTWVGALAEVPPVRWLNLHAGLDESTPQLTACWGKPEGVFDFFDEPSMTEPSIRRARSLAHNAVEPTPVDYRRLPVGNGSIDAIAILFAAHELRAKCARDALFGEIHRALGAGGRVVVVEHLRDVANFLAFGPGFLHFMPRSEWLRVAKENGFRIAKVLRKTPFVAAFVLEKSR